MKKYANKSQILRLAWRLGGALLFTNMPAFCAAQNQDNKKQKLEQAIDDLQKRKQREIADSLYKVTNLSKESFSVRAPDGSNFQLCQEGDVEELTKRHIHTANSRIEQLRVEASRPILAKYPLSRFLTDVELNFIKGDFAERIIYSIQNCSVRFDGNIRSIDQGAYYGACDFLIEFPLKLATSVWDLESNIKMLNYLEHRPSETDHDPFTADYSIYDTQIPNKNPVVMMRNGKLWFKNPAAQKLYEQYKSEMGSVVEKYILPNPELASRYYKHLAELQEAYENSEKLRKITHYYDQIYQRQADSLKFELFQLERGNGL